MGLFSSIQGIGKAIANIPKTAVNVVKDSPVFEAIQEAGKTVGKGAYGFLSNIRDGLQSFWDTQTGKTAQEQYEKSREDAQEQFQEAIRQYETTRADNQSQFQYQKELNELQMQREDSSYTRAAADATRAGLSLANISGAGLGAGSLSAGSGLGASGTVSGAVASPNSQAGNLLSTIASFISPIAGAITSEAQSKRAVTEQNRHNVEMENIARATASVGAQNAQTNAQNAKTNERNASTREREASIKPVVAQAQVRAANAQAALNEQETANRGDISTADSSLVKTAKAAPKVAEGMYNKLKGMYDSYQNYVQQQNEKYYARAKALSEFYQHNVSPELFTKYYNEYVGKLMDDNPAKRKFSKQYPSFASYLENKYRIKAKSFRGM